MNRTAEKFVVVWVEVGRPVPRYAVKNFRLMRKMFPEVVQYLVTDALDEFEDVIKIPTSSLNHSSVTSKFLKIKKSWPSRQEYFWQGTTSRFFYLFEAMKSHGLINVLHLETDSLLLDESAIQSLIDDERVDLAYPLQADKVGCASILYVRGTTILEEFLLFILKRWKEQKVDDMILLGEFSNNSKVRVLSTWIEGLGPSEKFIFDAQSIGKFYLGTDARNCRWPFSRRCIGDERKGSITNFFNDDKYDWDTHVLKRTPSITIQDNSRRASVANIHIHSKRISSSFTIMKMRFYIGFGPRAPFMWKAGAFDYSVFRERFASFVARRVLKRERFEERIMR